MADAVARKPAVSRGFVWTVVLVGLAFSVLIGMGMIAAELGKFGSDAVLAPLRIMAMLWQPTVYAALFVIVCVATGLRVKNLWFGAPIGVLLVAGYWLLASSWVVKLVRRSMEG